MLSLKDFFITQILIETLSDKFIQSHSSTNTDHVLMSNFLGEVIEKLHIKDKICIKSFERIGCLLWKELNTEKDPNETMRTNFVMETTSASS